jgi:hypothetical protein
MGEIERLREELADIKDGNRIILDEKCASDEVHCGCVPTLRKVIAGHLAAHVVMGDEIAKLRDQLTIARDELIAKRGDLDEISSGAAVDVLIQNIPEGDSFWVSRANLADVHYAVEVRRMDGATPAEEIAKLRGALDIIADSEDQVYSGEFLYHKGRADGLREAGAVARAARHTNDPKENQ